MNRIAICLAAAPLLAWALSPSIAGATPIDMTITADNHYAVYTGDEFGTALRFIGANETGAGGSPGRYNWSLPETFCFDIDDPYLYVAAWSDDNIAQGLLAELTVGGESILSGDPRWEVFATGADLDNNAAVPTVGNVSTHLGLVTTSGGWQAPVVGGANGVSPWGTVPGISTEAEWMWHLAPGQTDAFDPGYNHNEYLIFRIGVPEPASAVLLLAGMLGMPRRRRLR